MKKSTIEIHRVKGFTAGYGFLTPPFCQDSQSTLDELISWSAKKENKDKKIYRHILYQKDENLSYANPTYSSERNLSNKECEKLFVGIIENKIEHNMGMIYRMPTSDRVFYLDIYWQ